MKSLKKKKKLQQLIIILILAILELQWENNTLKAIYVFKSEEKTNFIQYNMHTS